MPTPQKGDIITLKPNAKPKLVDTNITPPKTIIQSQFWRVNDVQRNLAYIITSEEDKYHSTIIFDDVKKIVKRKGKIWQRND